VFVIHNSRPCPALPRRSHPSVGPEIRSLQSFQRFTLQTFKQHVISSRDEKSVTATPLESALTNRDARNSFKIRCYANCRVSLAFSPNSRTLHVPLSSLAATLMDHATTVANKRLTIPLNHLDATLTENQWGGRHPGRTSIPVRCLNLSPLFATLAQTPGVWGYSSHFGTPDFQTFQPSTCQQFFSLRAVRRYPLFPCPLSTQPSIEDPDRVGTFNFRPPALSTRTVSISVTQDIRAYCRARLRKAPWKIHSEAKLAPGVWTLLDIAPRELKQADTGWVRGRKRKSYGHAESQRIGSSRAS
jgi:hypothetical protein